MKKWWIWFAIASLLACERDDLCLQNPVIKINTIFLNGNNEKSPVDSLLVITASQDTLIPATHTDSTSFVPDPAQSGDTLIFKKVNGSFQYADTVLLNYNPGYRFVSKACGYKMIFTETNIELHRGNTSWIDSIRLITNSIDNDTITHIKIYH